VWGTAYSTAFLIANFVFENCIKTVRMSNIRNAFYLLSIWIMGDISKAKAQDYIRYNMSYVEQVLKEEKAKYHISNYREYSVISLVEGRDTAQWKFDVNNICVEYTLSIDKAKYTEIKGHMEHISQRIMENVYVNRKEKTITYIKKENGVLYVNTKNFDPTGSAPPIMFTENN